MPSQIGPRFVGVVNLCMCVCKYVCHVSVAMILGGSVEFAGQQVYRLNYVCLHQHVRSVSSVPGSSRRQAVDLGTGLKPGIGMASINMSFDVIINRSVVESLSVRRNRPV